jgi:hypothetical protein
MPFLSGFSIVKLATDRSTGEQYACKIMSLPAIEYPEENTTK